MIHLTGPGPRGSLRGLLILSAVGLAACSGSATTTSPAAPPAATANNPSTAAVPSAAPSVTAPSAAPSAAASAAAASAGSGAVPFGKNVCDLLPAATIDQTIGVKTYFHAWDNHVCTWISSNPTGGATIGWLAPGNALLAGVSGSTVPAGATAVSGLGLWALGRTQTGLPAPAAPTSASLLIALPQGGMTVHVSGPAVTLDEAVTLAHDVLGS